MNRKYNTQSFIEQSNIIHNYKYDYSKTVYGASEKHLIITCPIHGDFEQTPRKHMVGRGCKLCGYETMARERSSTENEFLYKAIELHGNKYSYNKVKYKNSDTLIILVCDKHGDFSIKPEKHLLGQGCRECNDSKGESFISNFLKLKSIKFIKEKTFDKCLSQKGKKLRFDFWLPEHNTCIEFDGEQHFKSNKYFGLKAFENTQINDKIKNQYCLDNNINLIRIKFNQIKDINQLLNSSLGPKS